MRPSESDTTRSAIDAITALCVITAVVVAELAIHALDRFQHPDAGVHVERARRLVAQQHVWSLGDRPRDRHPLLLAAREL